MGGRVKNRNKTMTKMLAGKITVEEARQRVGWKDTRVSACRRATWFLAPKGFLPRGRAQKRHDSRRLAAAAQRESSPH